MFKNKEYNETDAFHLNFGVPIVITLILFIVNIEMFAIFFIENIIEFIKIYLFFIMVVFFILYKKKGKTLKINMYIGVLSSLFVSMFLFINILITEFKFETTMKCSSNYDQNLKDYSIPSDFLKLYKISNIENNKYFFKNYVLQIEIGRSVFGYYVVSKREFVKI